jgi:hypothetical protein
MIEWRIKAREFANCNCDHGCPCQFNALPTYGNCEAVAAYEFDEGHFGDVRLDGLRAAGLYAWPKAVHEGNGTMQLIIDERADDAQREALLTIMQGGETEPMATMWAVYAAMVTTVLEPLSKPIDFEVNVDKRTARLIIPGVVEGAGEPIRNPVTGAEHRARIDLPNGFEYEIAEIGSGTSKSTGEIKLDLKSSYGQFAAIHLCNPGIVRAAA